MTNIGIISDTHGELPPIEMFDGIDTLVHCGDIGPDYNVAKWIRSKFVPWIIELETAGIQFAGTLGNHDFPKYWHLSDLDKYPIDVWGPVRIAGKSAFLSAYSPKFFDWAWMKPETQLKDMYDSIPKDVEILVSHTPPAGGPYGTMLNGEDVGSTALEQWLKENPQCRHVWCGHIHEGWGQYTLESGQHIINAAYCDEYYTPMGRFQRITL